ncbi:MAG: DUF1569 domain-containing protein [Bacteroidetes bacterium]|nr:DUF1569 domain-containing protein [Bacteroidota bacterium]
MEQVEKLKYLKHDAIYLLKKLSGDEVPDWGLMNVQQMIEHLSDSVRIANGKDPHSLITPAENLEKLQAFMLSDKEFRPNTPNSLLPKAPAPVKLANIAAAIKELEQEISDFELFFSDDHSKIQMNPFFGPLTFEQWTHLFHKHFRHHLRQFKLIA